MALARPLTYMNRSGLAVRDVLDRTSAARETLLVVCDEVHLPLGRIRLRPMGSHGGHRGLESVIGELGTAAIPRLRIGVGQEAPPDDLVAFVLGKFRGDERGHAERVCVAAADVVLDWVVLGCEATMNRYNNVTIK